MGVPQPWADYPDMPLSSTIIPRSSHPQNSPWTFSKAAPGSSVHNSTSRLPTDPSLETIGWSFKEEDHRIYMRNPSHALIVHRPESLDRGTFGLLFSCILTLFICVYTVLHLNVSPGVSRVSLSLQKFLWALVGIFAPELIVYIAWRQWQSAKELTREINLILDRQKAKQTELWNRKHAWTMTHSFYAGMGGFAFNIENDGSLDYFPESWCLSEHKMGRRKDKVRSHLTLTAHGVRMLAEHSRLPDISARSIKDKSKADTIAKGVAILQGVWMIVQCIGRATAHLPLTFLELHTLAHVLCTFFMYLLWMKKPYDVMEPIQLEGDWVRPMCATFIMFSRLSHQRESYSGITYRFRAEIERLLHIDTQKYPPNSTDLDAPLRTNSSFSATRVRMLEDITTKNGLQAEEQASAHSISPEQDEQTEAAISDPQRSQTTNECSKLRVLDRFTGKLQYRDLATDERPIYVLQSNDIVYDWGLGTKPNSVHFKFRQESHNQDGTTTTMCYSPPVRLNVNERTLVRWHLALTFMDQYPTIWKKNRVLVEKAAPSLSTPVYHYPDHTLKENYIDVSSHFWPGKDLLGQSFALVPIVTLSLATAAYGGIHAMAWTEYFPTNNERNLWKVSSVIISSSGIMWSIIRSLLPVRKALRISLAGTGLCRKLVRGFLTIGMVVGLVSLTFFTFTFCVGARVYLVVEAFHSLRKLPLDAYKTPRWTQYIPHL